MLKVREHNPPLMEKRPRPPWERCCGRVCGRVGALADRRGQELSVREWERGAPSVASFAERPIKG